jgi:hypothetical protein
MDSKIKLKAQQLLSFSLWKNRYDINDFNIKFMEYQGIHFVYCLTLCDDAIYVGHTKSVYSRIISHKMKYNFDSFHLVQYDKKDVLYAEREWIKLLQPTFNIRSKNL